MEKACFILMVVLSIGFWMPCAAEELRVVTVSELIRDGKTLDGVAVRMTVEMIGDVMNRGDYSWINGSDTTGALGYWLPAKAAAEVKILGNSRFEGDTAEIQGVFHRACPEHGGDMDVHVNSLKIIKTGIATENAIPKGKTLTSFLMTIVMLAVAGFWWKGRAA